MCNELKCGIFSSMRLPYIVYLRSHGKKRATFYAAFLDPATGKYDTRRAIRDVHGRPVTGEKLALTLAAQMATEIVPGTHGGFLVDFLEDFWRPGGAYAAEKAGDGTPLSRAYLTNSALAVKNHLRPWIEETMPHLRVGDVTPDFFRALKKRFAEGGLSPRTVNTIYQVVSVPCAHYWTGKGKPERNPSLAVKRLSERASRKRREIFTPAEATRVLNSFTDPRHATLNRLAASTGMRLGECLGLQHDDILKGEILVRHNWQDGEGVKAPKWGSSRRVPLAKTVERELRALITSSKYGGPFVFEGITPARPMGKKMVELSFNAAVEAAKIPEEERRRRGLTFHSWRHFFRSMLDGAGLSARAGDELTGHRNEEVGELYNHVTEAQRKAVARIASELTDSR